MFAGGRKVLWGDGTEMTVWALVILPGVLGAKAAAINPELRTTRERMVRTPALVNPN
jgi:hypothetical protein